MKHPQEPYYIKEVNGKGKGLFASRKIKKGEKILQILGEKVDRKDITSEIMVHALQIDDHTFFHSEEDIADDFLNHSCDPNTYIEFPNLDVIAIKTINKDEEITFDYSTTEYDLHEQGIVFECQCQSPKCHGTIAGFKFLSKDEQFKLAPYLSPFLRKKLEKSIYTSSFYQKIGLLLTALIFAVFNSR
jgi:SET domain-containing protein